MTGIQKRIEWPRSERVQDARTREWSWKEVGTAELDAHLALGWRVVHLAGAGESPRWCAILEAPSGLDSNGDFRP